MSEKDHQQIKGEITIADLYPELSPEDQRRAEFGLLSYLAVVKDIFEEICESNPDFLTELERRAMLRKKRDKPRS